MLAPDLPYVTLVLRRTLSQQIAVWSAALLRIRSIAKLQVLRLALDPSVIGDCKLCFDSYKLSNTSQALQLDYTAAVIHPVRGSVLNHPSISQLSQG